MYYQTLYAMSVSHQLRSSLRQKADVEHWRNKQRQREFKQGSVDREGGPGDGENIASVAGVLAQNSR